MGSIYSFSRCIVSSLCRHKIHTQDVAIDCNDDSGHHQTVMMIRSASIVSTCESPKEWERNLDQRANRLFGVLYRWLDLWDCQPSLQSWTSENDHHWIMAANSPRFKKCNVSKHWLAVLSIKPSVEHSKKPTSTLIWASCSLDSMLDKIDSEHAISVHT